MYILSSRPVAPLSFRGSFRVFLFQICRSRLHRLPYPTGNIIDCQRQPYMQVNANFENFDPIVLFHTLGPYVHFVVMASCSPFVSWTKDQEFVGMLDVHKVHIVSVGLLPTYQVCTVWSIYIVQVHIIIWVYCQPHVIALFCAWNANFLHISTISQN